jgi:hypothetical protein
MAQEGLSEQLGVSAYRHHERMTTTLIALIVLVATCIQTFTSVKELGRSRRKAVDWWDAEDQLVEEHRWWRKRTVRRELKSWRDPGVHRDIRHLQLALLSWVLLVFAAASSTVVSVASW